MNISTIYRNLDQLVRLGVIDRSHLGGGPAAYHLASATHGHRPLRRLPAAPRRPVTEVSPLTARTR